ncbi:septum formation inhibitor Maf [bacterium]|nr:septum formation inhibitor Maf [bacterium]
MHHGHETIILASKSPRRAELLRQIGLSFTVVPAAIDEERISADHPADLAMILARQKAEAVAAGGGSGLIIGADTVVYLQGETLGKPASPGDAFDMLQRLSGKTHHVYTGFVLLDTAGGDVTDVAATAVTFKTLDDWEIEAYIATGSPMDKAGAYGIQDVSSLFVTRIDGCFYNVVGFPLNRFYEALVELWGKKRVRRLFDVKEKR